MYPLRPLGELCEVSIGRQRSPKHATGPDMIPYIRAANVKDGWLALDDILQMNFTPAEQVVYRLSPGDVLVTEGCGSPAELGASAVWRGQIDSVVGFQNHVLRLRAVEGRSDAGFLGHVARWCHHAGRWRAVASGTSILNIGLTRARTVAVPAPTFPTQQKVGAALSSFDEMIRNNSRRIEILEDSARSFYREWFVHFRFPGHNKPGTKVQSGALPAGWRMENLLALADVSFGAPLKSAGFGGDGKWQVIRIRDIPPGSTKTRTDEFPGDRYIVDNGDLLIGMDGEFHLARWSGDQALLNQRVTRVRPRASLGTQALLLGLEQPIREWNGRIVGTTVAHLGKRHLEEIHLAVPDDALLQEVNKRLEALGDLTISLRLETRRLIAARDLLLPKLVTGQVDIDSLGVEDVFGWSDLATAGSDETEPGGQPPRSAGKLSTVG